MPRRPTRTCLLSAILLVLFLLQTAFGAESLNHRLLLVYDSRTPDSVAVAKYYAHARNIPDANLCSIRPPDSSARSTSLADYLKFFKKPVQDCLTRVGKDRILYIVLAYVRPHVVELPTKMREYALDSYLADIWDAYINHDFDSVPTGTHPYYAFNRARENAFQPFVPLAVSRAQPGAPLIYSVWRLDGATPAIARSLVDKAIKTEAAHGPSGIACIDEKMDPSPYPDLGYRAGDWDLLRAAQFLTAAGYKVIEDRNDAEFGTSPAPGCPKAALYAGWYSLNHYNDAFSWVDGAIGFHLDSLSVLDPRTGPNWVANALKHGITATSGAVNEPYLMGLPRPSGLFRDLLAGSNLGDALLRNTRFLKWMIINVGDPLYTPFAGGKRPQHLPK